MRPLSAATILRRSSTRVRQTKRRGRGHLRQGIHVEGLPDLVERLDQFRIGDAVADSQPGEAEDLREGPQDHEVREFVEPGDGIDLLGRG